MSFSKIWPLPGVEARTAQVQPALLATEHLDGDVIIQVVENDIGVELHAAVPRKAPRLVHIMQCQTQQHNPASRS